MFSSWRYDRKIPLPLRSYCTTFESTVQRILMHFVNSIPHEFSRCLFFPALSRFITISITLPLHEGRYKPVFSSECLLRVGISHA
jgi:hypothetical protein